MLKNAIADADGGAKKLVDAFKAGGDIHAVSQGSVAQPSRRPDIADKDAGTIEPDPYPDSRPSFRLPGIVDAFHPACRPQGGGAGAQNMVGALNRSIPERHDAVADELVNGAAFFRYCRRDFLEIGRDLDQKIVRRESLGVAGEILQIGKENSDESRLDAQSQRNARLDELADSVARNERGERFQRGPKTGTRKLQPCKCL